MKILLSPNFKINEADLTDLKDKRRTSLSPSEYPANELKNSPVKDLNVVSLFSGCGGMDLGFEGGFIAHKKSINESITADAIGEQLDPTYVRLKKTRFKTVFANDIMPDAGNTWYHYFQKHGYNRSIYHLNSIVDLVKDYRTGVNVFPDKTDVVTGGFPCQDFSLSGKRKGLNSHKNHKGKLSDESDASEETRGQLYMWMKQVIEITRPKMFIAENVKGLVNLSNVKEIIQKDFAEAADGGYFVFDPQVLHAADYGVPQSRERVIFIGVKKSALKPGLLKKLMKKEIDEALNPYPPVTHQFNKQGDQLKPLVTLGDVLGLLVEPGESSDLSHQHYSKAKFMGKHCQGQSEIKLNYIGPTIRSEHHGNIEFRRLSAANDGKYAEELKSGLPERRLTPRECAIIQSFPPDFDFVIPGNQPKKKFLVSPSQAYKVIGNAVAPLMAYNIARRIERLWDVYFEAD